MNKKFINFAAILLFLSGCSSDGFKISSDFNSSVNFSSYKTFSWISDQPFMGGDSSVSPLTRQRVQDAISTQLKTVGYEFVGDPMFADFVVSYTVGSRQEIRVDAYPTYYGGSTMRLGRGSYWGPAPYGSFSGTDVRVREYTEGQLAIDIFEVKTGQPVWHGTAQKTITTKDRSDPKPIIDEAVARILAEFPPDQN